MLSSSLRVWTTFAIMVGYICYVNTALPVLALSDFLSSYLGLAMFGFSFHFRHGPSWFKLYPTRFVVVYGWPLANTPLSEAYSSSDDRFMLHFVQEPRQHIPILPGWGVLSPPKSSEVQASSYKMTSPSRLKVYAPKWLLYSLSLILY